VLSRGFLVFFELLQVSMTGLRFTSIFIIDETFCQAT
jgi:hypothetical protein